MSYRSGCDGKQPRGRYSRGGVQRSGVRSRLYKQVYRARKLALHDNVKRKRYVFSFLLFFVHPSFSLYHLVLVHVAIEMIELVHRPDISGQVW